MVPRSSRRLSFPIGIEDRIFCKHSKDARLIARFVMRIALWSTGYCRGFGGSEQMVNALIRRFSRHGLDIIIIADGDRGGRAQNLYFTSLPIGIETHVDTFPNPLLCRRPAAF